MRPIIEAAKPEDAPAIFALLETNALPVEGLADHMATALVARVAGKVVGCAALEVYGESALLRSVAVAAEWRGHGLGVELAQSALRLARERGVTCVYLLTETAPDFFSRLGFRFIERAYVALDVQQSVEFTNACPLTAPVMVIDLQHE